MRTHSGMKTIFFFACVISLLWLIGHTWTTAQEPLQRARAQALRVAEERGIVVAQLTRFAGERVVWTAIGTDGATPVLLMISDDQVTRLLEQQTISEADMRQRIVQAYANAHIVRLVRGVFQGQWVWEAWIRYDARD
ncbi:MAG: hypothetical protein KGO83_05575, partial [Paenibacillaceae bacterium]|nr:hypothetical protein [Paenibacillaceae bacterium]